MLEGPLANLYIVKVGPELLLVIAYTRTTTFGMVRIFVKETQKKLLMIAKDAAKAREEAVHETTLEEGFDEELSQQLDELFADDLGL
mgnify:FL=1